MIVPVSASSVLGMVVRTRAYYLGPLPPSGNNNDLLLALGRTKPRNVLITTEGRPMAGYGSLVWRGPRSFLGGRILAGHGLEGPELGVFQAALE